MYIPIYDGQSVSLWRGGLDAPWNAIHVHVLGPQEYALIDGIWAVGDRGAATLRRWHAGMQSGALDVLQWQGDSSWTIPLAEDLGLGVPILGDTARIFIATAERVLGFDLVQQTLSWSIPLPFAWPIPGWCLLPEGLLCLNHEGEGVLLDPGDGCTSAILSPPGNGLDRPNSPRSSRSLCRLGSGHPPAWWFWSAQEPCAFNPAFPRRGGIRGRRSVPRRAIFISFGSIKKRAPFPGPFKAHKTKLTR